MLPPTRHLQASRLYQPRFLGFIGDVSNRLFQVQILGDFLQSLLGIVTLGLKLRGWGRLGVAFCESAIGPRADAEGLRILSRQPVSRVVLGDVVLSEFIHRFCDIRDQLAVGAHLLDGGLDNGLKHVLDQASHKLREVHFLDQFPELLNALLHGPRLEVLADLSGSFGEPLFGGLCSIGLRGRHRGRKRSGGIRHVGGDLDHSGRDSLLLLGGELLQHRGGPLPESAGPRERFEWIRCSPSSIPMPSVALRRPCRSPRALAATCRNLTPEQCLPQAPSRRLLLPLPSRALTRFESSRFGRSPPFSPKGDSRS